MQHFHVRLPVDAAAARIQEYVETGSFSAELAGSYRDQSPQGHTVITLVFEKYFMRNSGRASLTVTIADLGGITDVWALGAGGADGGLLSFDFGAGESFEREVCSALEGYIQ